MIKKYLNFINENLNNFQFKELFLELTKYTVPYGYEETLEPILRKHIPNLKKDGIGNYYIQIGNSKTLFTSHLDTFSKTKKKVNHVIDGNIIKTDETTVLGGDNKNGVVILIYLITQNIPGTYFFFIGEESIVNGGGCYGSTNALMKNKEFFHKFNKAIAFDRRGKGSLVKRQSGRFCASDDFADALIEKFNENGLEFGKDNAYRTDSAVFMDTIPEITNLSSGGEFEHTYMETSDIDYIEKVAKAASNIDWDNLPIVRKLTPIPNEIKDEIKSTIENTEISKRIFLKVKTLMSSKGFICLNPDEFSPGVIMYFNKFLEESQVSLVINGNNIKCTEGHKKIGKFREGNFKEFKEKQKLKIKNFSRSIWLAAAKKMDTNNILSNNELNEILNNYDITYDEFKNYMENDSDEKEFIQFKNNHIELDIKILHQGLKNKQSEQEQVLIKKENDKYKQDEIKKTLNYLGEKWYKVSDVNTTRIKKYLKNRNDITRFYGIKHFNKNSGSWDGQIWGEDIKDTFKYWPPDLIYDQQLDISYESLF